MTPLPSHVLDVLMPLIQSPLAHDDMAALADDWRRVTGPHADAWCRAADVLDVMTGRAPIVPVAQDGMICVPVPLDRVIEDLMEYGSASNAACVWMLAVIRAVETHREASRHG